MGSERRSYRKKKLTTEECWSLDAADLPRPEAGRPASGILRTGRIVGKSTLRVRYNVEATKDGPPILTLSHQRRTAGQELTQCVRLLTTRPNFGGLRWWFSCPLVRKGKPCGRRVGKLYLPPRKDHFGCRHCYSLTYRSSQQSHRYDSWFDLLSGGNSEVAEFMRKTYLVFKRETRRRVQRSSSLLDAFGRRFGERREYGSLRRGAHR